jgi:hypothetical protein
MYRSKPPKSLARLRRPVPRENKARVMRLTAAPSLADLHCCMKKTDRPSDWAYRARVRCGVMRVTARSDLCSVQGDW